MTTTSTASLVDSLRQYRILEATQLEELKSLQVRFPAPKALAKELIQRGWLTPYQANQLFQGKGQKLLLGPYILLERLGEGGMGQVFKARHSLMKRIVALKLIHQERLATPETLLRFRREIEAVAKLSHPNIITAFDAGQVGDSHFLVMEYEEGIDLHHLIHKSGPLPVPQASSVIRQAALGLQHAHERGLVHRDIKPSNLFLAEHGAVVKILDMGIARSLSLSVPKGKTSTILTQVGTVIGTPDFMAPEQIDDSSQVDIRADLYSLGCTFYFLLAGRPPFGEGSLTQKLIWQQQAEPVAIESVRSDLPPGLGDVLRKMMAKRPADRYQTPVELVHALAPFCQGHTKVAIPAAIALGNERDLTPDTQPTTVNGQVLGYEKGGTLKHEPTTAIGFERGLTMLPGPATASFEKPERDLAANSHRLESSRQMKRQGRRRHLLPLLAGIAGLLLATLVVVIVLLRPPPPGASTEKPPVAERREDDRKEVDAPGKAIDLLKLVKPEKDTVTGKWSFQGDTLVSPMTKGFAKLQLPHIPPEEYDLKLVMERKAGHVAAIGLIGKKRRFMLQLDEGLESARRSGLEMLDGKRVKDSPFAHKGPVFKTGTPSDVFVAVRKTTITVKVDSKTVVSFKGDFNRLSMQRKDMDIPNQEVLYLVTYRTIFHFKKIELTPVSGEGKPTVATE